MNDRNYSSWEICETINYEKREISIDPIACKLFSNDVFTIGKNNSVNILHSSIRSGSPMPGVLILAGNKTYGRENNKNIKNQKLLYKCVPDDMRLPSFLIGYEFKSIGFSKVYKNLYVTFNFSSWDDKHPHGKLCNVIGPVDVLDNFYEYQLYCKSLNTSIQKFQKDTSKALETKSPAVFIENIKTKYPSIQDRTDTRIWHIFTIDPKNSLDLDDGFSIRNLDDGVKQISIYIANVTIWMDILNLWDSFSQRISTIYLPDKKRPMLPTMLSDCLCSLHEKVTRIAFVMDIFLKDEQIIDIKYANAFVKVVKNYSYEEFDLLKDENYNNLMNATRLLSYKFKYINHIKNSHELVCYLMIFMNYHCATELLKSKSGIFRSTIMNKSITVPDSVPEDVSKFIVIWNSASGQYVDCANINSDKDHIRHDLLDIDSYIHITSPIRRLVDLLNIIKFQEVSGIIKLSENVMKFYDKWINNLDYINVTMRSIRKVQCDCSLLDLCAKNPDIMEKEYDGYLFDKIYRNDGLYQYIVFLPELKLSSRITLRENYENYDCKKVKLYLFNNEEKFKKKIRLHLIS